MAKIAIVYNTSWYIYIFRSNLIRELLANNHEVFTVAPEDGYTEKLIKMGCQHHHIAITSSSKNPIGDLIILNKFYKIYKKIRPDILLNYTIKPNVYSTIAGSLLGAKSINNIAGLGTLFTDKSFVTKIAVVLYKLGLARANWIFFQNADDKNLFKELGIIKKANYSILPGSGVDLKRFNYTPLPHNDEKIIFTHVSRMLYSKGVELLFKAGKILSDKGYTRFIIKALGDCDVDNPDSISRELLEEWSKESYFNYVGRTDKVIDYYQNAHCVVLASYYREGVPRSLLEACSVGRPIITTNSPGCKEVIVDNRNGFLVEPKNAEDLALKMELVLNMNYEELNKLGQQSRKIVEESFDEKIVLKYYLDKINEIHDK